MGLSSQAIVMGIISQVYTLDLEINRLYQEKFVISRVAQLIGLEKSRALGAQDGVQVDVPKIDFSSGKPVVAMRDVPNPAGGVRPVPKHERMRKEAAVAQFETYLADLNSQEKEIDMKLETLKAQRVALNSQREEFTKYVAEGIKMTFKNNYA